MHIVMDRKDYKINKKSKWVLQAIHISIKPIFQALWYKGIEILIFKFPILYAIYKWPLGAPARSVIDYVIVYKIIKMIKNVEITI